MQIFQDTATGKMWAFDPDVIVTDTAGVYSFTAAHGAPLATPTTLQPFTGTWPPVPPAPTLAQEAAAALGAGLTLTISGTMTLAATVFPTDAATTAKIADMAAMAARGVLPLGATDYPMKDALGAWHHFTAGQYQVVGAAIASYAAALILIVDGNPLGATGLPSASGAVTV